MIEGLLKDINLDRSKEYIIFDVGSRDCMQSIEFYKEFPNSKIYAFECNPNTLQICRNNIKDYGDRITLIEGAVTDYDGDIEFFPIDQKNTITSWQDGNPGASSLYVNNGTYEYEKYVQYKIKTNCHRLDTVMNNNNIPRVDLIWMDLQGAELIALKGLGDYLDRVKCIYTEVSHKEIYTGQVMYEELNYFMISNKFKLSNKLSMRGWQEDALYVKNIEHINEFDIVIPIGPDEIESIKEQIKYTKKNVIGYRNIYIIPCDPRIKIEGCITINENMFPFSKKNIPNIITNGLSRTGWYLQQLLKLYAGIIIPNILDRYLVIDSDTYFMKETTFIERNKCLYNYGTEYHMPYFIHMKKLHPNFEKVFANVSGICHHMIFETKIIKEIFEVVEKYKNDKFYNVFINNIDCNEMSGASEYEIYFNYIFRYHRGDVEIRQLNWVNSASLNNDKDYHYISRHWYLKKDAIT